MQSTSYAQLTQVTHVFRDQILFWGGVFMLKAERILSNHTCCLQGRDQTARAPAVGYVAMLGHLISSVLMLHLELTIYDDTT